MAEPTVVERDLRPQVSGLGGLEKEVLFQHIRTGQNPVTIYAMADGEKIEIPEHLLASAMQKKDAEGNWMFTQKAEEAPTYVGGTVKCFLHADSPERASGVLDKIGLAGKRCPKDNLASEHSKRIHAATRHSKEQEALQDYLDREEKQEDRDAQRKQLDATLDLARGVSGSAAVEADAAPAEQATTVLNAIEDQLPSCGQCDFIAKSNAGLSAHVRGAHGDVPE